MKCLSCQRLISDSSAVYTRSCRHVFCLSCASEKFDEELVCPLCGTVLPKDGTKEINLRPDSDEIEKASEPGFGLEPKLLCEILQNGLDFWAQQQKNESSIQIQSQSKLCDELNDEKVLNRKLSMTLENERLRSKSVLQEKEVLLHQLTMLEKKYEEKSRSFQKLKESYKELRMVHKRLETDLHQVQLASDPPFDDSNHFQAIKPPSIEEIQVGRKGGSASTPNSSLHDAQELNGSQSNSRSIPFSCQESGRDSMSLAQDIQYDFKLDNRPSRMETATRTEELDLLRSGRERGKRRAERTDKHDGRRRYG